MLHLRFQKMHQSSEPYQTQMCLKLQIHLIKLAQHELFVPKQLMKPTQWRKWTLVHTGVLLPGLIYKYFALNLFWREIWMIWRWNSAQLLHQKHQWYLGVLHQQNPQMTCIMLGTSWEFFCKVYPKDLMLDIWSGHGHIEDLTILFERVCPEKCSQSPWSDLKTFSPFVYHLEML